SEPNTSGQRSYRLAVVFLLMLVVFLLVAITILWVKLATERDQIQTIYNNLTTERDQIQTIYNNLTAEKNQLETSYQKVVKEKDQFQRKADELQRKLSLLGWKLFRSSIYYMSSEKKSWRASRQDCQMKGADLVIIKDREEQNFLETLRRGETAWIGANDIEREGVWKWVDGTAVTNG
ncbi:CD209 antigen-like protein C, partial [Clarias magur]